MTIAPGQDGGPEETHAGDQVVFVVEGEAIVTVEGTAHQARAGACVLIPAGALHHVRNPARAAALLPHGLRPSGLLARSLER